jgi:hypothetical protein
VSETGPYRKPDAFTVKVLQPLVNAFSMTPTLTVRGRSSGKAHTVSVLPIEVEGKRYRVAPRGNTQWARNLRAVGEADLKLGRERMHVKASEIPVSERGPLVAAYVQQHGKKYGGFVAREFAAMPDPAHHPVFVLERVP